MAQIDPSLREATETFLDEAASIATKKFGADAVRDNPGLTTDIALFMSNLIVAQATRRKG
ncbi:hypothetical protein [Palleronia caenipelagi]|uniref:Uncharacterized protein n=1 Tax=Palleronia caenipelagi TaxID=2489174 RepID=A0A547Q7V6_9RHOB|nr:hypothetical protein [Palleronia caenipelagi]TRD22475.1 hypothetical protein FEV53_05305 [Palleronia caenipelagi]